MKISTSILSIAAAAAFTGATQAVTFTDTTFASGNWNVFQQFTSNGSSHNVGQDNTAGLGNASPYLQMQHHIAVNPKGNQVPTFVNIRHVTPSFVWNPAEDGAIDFIDMSMDAIIFQTSNGTTPAVGHAFMLIQNNTPYFYDMGTFTNMSWQTFTATGLTAEMFTSSIGNPHPNFSIEGAPIMFGFLRSNTNTGQTGDVFITHGADNFSVTIHPTIVPGPAALAALALAGAAPRRRRK